jgi:ankyrin repeat protein
LLLKKGADTTIKNCYGDTAKDIALIYNQKWFLKQVREKPGDSNNSGDTI